MKDIHDCKQERFFVDLHLQDSATKFRLILADYEHEPPGPNTRYLKAGQKVCGISICGVQANPQRTKQNQKRMLLAAVVVAAVLREELVNVNIVRWLLQMQMMT